MLRITTTLLAISALILTIPQFASADAIPWPVQACEGLEVGDSCSTDAFAYGRCEEATCTRTEFNDGGGPFFVEYDCIECWETDPPEGSNCAVSGSGTSVAGSIALSFVTLGVVFALRLRRRR